MGDLEMRGEVRAERCGDGVLRVTFDRPEARNAMTFAMYDRLAEIARAASADATLRAVIFSGAGGKAFVSGTDIAEFRAFRTDDDAVAYERRIADTIDAVARIPAPAIAAIEGSCVGGGFAIAAACDLRIATTASRFGFPVARGLGNCLSATTLSSLVWLIGGARTVELVFRARLVGAEEAQRLGLVHEVVPSAETLHARADELAQHLATLAPLTLRATKEGLRRIRERSVPETSDLLRMCYGSEDFQEGMAAFFEKREPRWKGR